MATHPNRCRVSPPRKADRRRQGSGYKCIHIAARRSGFGRELVKPESVRVLLRSLAVCYALQTSHTRRSTARSWMSKALAKPPARGIRSRDRRDKNGRQQQGDPLVIGDPRVIASLLGVGGSP